MKKPDLMPQLNAAISKVENAKLAVALKKLKTRQAVLDWLWSQLDKKLKTEDYVPVDVRLVVEEDRHWISEREEEDDMDHEIPGLFAICGTFLVGEDSVTLSPRYITHPFWQWVTT